MSKFKKWEEAMGTSDKYEEGTTGSLRSSDRWPCSVCSNSILGVSFKEWWPKGCCSMNGRLRSVAD